MAKKTGSLIFVASLIGTLLFGFATDARAQDLVPDADVVARLLSLCMADEECLHRLEERTDIQFYTLQELEFFQFVPAPPTPTRTPTDTPTATNTPTSTPTPTDTPTSTATSPPTNTPEPTMTPVVIITPEVMTEIVTETEFVEVEVPVTRVVTVPHEITVTEVLTVTEEIVTPGVITWETVWIWGLPLWGWFLIFVAIGLLLAIIIAGALMWRRGWP